MDYAVNIENLGKRYRLGLTHAGSVRELVNRQFGKWFGKGKATSELTVRSGDDSIDGDGFWALRDVSVQIPRGSAVGVIGKNGAGKSTLLKILSRITHPTTGRAILKGRLASLLEVGTGFHPELTGRENVFLNGAILGMTKREMQRPMDAIIAFAGVDKFIDTPVKRYSSGMTVRLGFAVAAHLSPEILVVDEVLAVGDLEFQQRCLGKMDEVARSGRTVLFVSHNLASVRQLTTQCIFLRRGRLEFFGETSEALARYVRGDRPGNETTYDLRGTERPFGGLQRGLEFLEASLQQAEGHDFLEQGELNFSVLVQANQEVPSFRLGMTIFRDDQTAVGSCFSTTYGPLQAGESMRLPLVVKGLPLANGEYYCAISAGSAATSQTWELFDSVSEVLRFRVTLGEAGGGFQAWQPGWGAVRLPDIQKR